MKWVVENTGNAEALINRLTEKGKDALILRPFTYLADDFKLPSDDIIICHGSIGMSKHLNGQGFMFNEAQLRCSYYYPRYSQWLLVGDEYEIIKGKDLYSHKGELYRRYGVQETIFIKPDTNDKIFSGTLLEASRFDNEARYIGLTFPKADIVISRPWKIKDEWRFFIANGEIVAGSSYKINGFCKQEKDYPREAACVAQYVFNTWTPHPMMVVDICSSGDEYCLLEIGSWNCAGYYACDLDKIIDAAEAIYKESQCQESFPKSK